MSTAPAMLSFTFDGTQLRAFEEGGESWFVAQDVCAMLGLGNPSSALARLEDYERCRAVILTNGGPQQLLTVSESGVYFLIFRSRSLRARAFRQWVTREVLPAIRIHGRYELPSASLSRG